MSLYNLIRVKNILMASRENDKVALISVSNWFSPILFFQCESLVKSNCKFAKYNLCNNNNSSRQWVLRIRDLIFSINAFLPTFANNVQNCLIKSYFSRRTPLSKFYGENSQILFLRRKRRGKKVVARWFDKANQRSTLKRAANLSLLKKKYIYLY